jgi:5-methylcytosine-specific restriction endonuclease McrA
MSNFPLPYSSLKRSTKPIRKRKHAQIRVGRVSGTVRLSGKAMEGLRRSRFAYDRGFCQDCGKSTFFTPRFDGDPDAFDLAHIRSRGAGGSDTLDNVVTKCHRCHMREHAGRKG